MLSRSYTDLTACTTHECGVSMFMVNSSEVGKLLNTASPFRASLSHTGAVT